MAGRPRKVLEMSTGKIGKAEKQRRIEQEKANKLPRDQLYEAPAWLSFYAKEEFERVVNETSQIDLLDNLDLGILAIYCNAYASYVSVTRQLQDEGYVQKRETKIDEYTVTNPLVNVQEKYVKQIMSCSSKLGLATTDRLKLIVPTKEESEVNKYLKYV